MSIFFSTDNESRRYSVSTFQDCPLNGTATPNRTESPPLPPPPPLTNHHREASYSNTNAIATSAETGLEVLDEPVDEPVSIIILLHVINFYLKILYAS